MRRVLFALLLARSAAQAEPITMSITEVAGELAFVDAGEESALKPGMPVTAGTRTGVVVEVNAKTAAVRLTGAAIGEQLTAIPDAPPTPSKLADSTGQWPAPILPATQETPSVIPLRGASDDRRVSLAIIGHAFGTAGQGNRRGEGELRVIGSFELLRERPLGADLDASARVYAKGFDRVRPPILVRAASLRYGDPTSPDLALGRLHYATTGLGLLDGGRASLKLGSKYELAAFGGLVPDPIDGKPTTTASRFGTEFVYDDRESAYRPRLAIGAHGSTWRGELDERRLNVVATAVVGGTWLDAWTEVSSFAADNPFGASQIEVTGAGASVEWRRRDAHLGADITYIVPERSLRIAELIPEWLCTRVPLAAGMAEPCTGTDRFGAATIAGGVRGDAWALDGALSLAYTSALATTFAPSGYLRGEWRRGIGSVHATASGGRTYFGDWVSGEVGAAIAPTRKFDVGLAYRPERLDETPFDAVVIHSIVADARASVTPALDLGAFVLTSFGANREVLAGMLTFALRR